MRFTYLLRIPGMRRGSVSENAEVPPIAGRSVYRLIFVYVPIPEERRSKQQVYA